MDAANDRGFGAASAMATRSWSMTRRSWWAVGIGGLCLSLIAANPPAPTTRHAPHLAARLARNVPTQPPAMIFQPSASPADGVLINASLPFAGGPIVSARPYVLDGAGEDRIHALTCLTAAIYYEAGSESDAGEAAVAQVVLNRARHPLFPKSVCGVVFEGAEKASGCQFTFTCDGSLARRPSTAGWARAEAVAERALNGYVMPSVGLATHYHADYVAPDWSTTMPKLAQIGAHIFYSWNGSLERSESADVDHVTDESAAWALASRKLSGIAEPSAPAPRILPPAPLVAAEAKAANAQPALVKAPKTASEIDLVSVSQAPLQISPPSYFEQPANAGRPHHSPLSP